jgi:tryptophanyl-tRNA synthetase
MQPSGELHLGNYLGALRTWIDLQEDHECFFCVVDYHAITAAYDPGQMPQRILDLAAGWLAAGIDPCRSTIFVQSRVPEHTELAWVLSSVAPMGELGRMTQFKDKAQDQSSVPVGLFQYPVLQAADILLYKATLVPVGEDQVQHLELCREITRRFNRRFGEIFPEPETLVGRGARILGLDGKRKMSKSLDNHIALMEEPDLLWKKLSTAVTDENRKRRSDPGNPEVCNLFSLHRHFTGAEEIGRIDRDCRTAGIGCVDCKRILEGSLNRALEPIRERARDWRSRPDKIEEVLKEGAERCRKIAQETMREVRSAMGLR